jgi:hypothetical protein
MIIATHGILANSAPLNPLNTNLVGVWNGDGNANDSFGSNNGTAVGGLTYATGKINNAFQFNGINAYVTLPNNLLNFTGDFSVNFWLNLQGVGGDIQMIVSNFQSNTLASSFYGWDIIVSNQELKFQIFDGTTNFDNFITNIISYYYVWTMFTVVKRGVNIKVYANNVLLNTFTQTKTLTYTSTHTPSLGARKTAISGGDVRYYMSNTGKIDAMTIWNRELTTTEISDLYNSSNGKQYPY